MILQPTPSHIQLAADALHRGDCVGLPTETVYGLAGDGLNAKAVAQIFDIKKRPSFDPLILHVYPGYDLSNIVMAIPDTAKKLMDSFWPGPLTLILPRKPSVPDLVTSGLDTVAVRCPDHPVARTLLETFGKPLAAPSANLFGRLSPTSAHAVDEELGLFIALTLDGGPCRVGVESTIVDCSQDPARVLRLGAIPVEELEACLGKVDVLEKSPVVAPGMLDNHYAPRTPLYLCENLNDGPLPDGGAGLAFTAAGSGMGLIKVLSLQGDLREAAASLFSHLRELDHAGVCTILAERVPEEGLGRAINDRLWKASAGTARWTGSEWQLAPR